MAKHRVRDTLLSLALKPREMARSLSRLMPAASPQGLTVMSLDGQWLKLLQADGPERARRITKLFVSPVVGKSPNEVAKTFKELYATEGVLPRDILVANPTPLSTVRLFSLPSTDPKEIRDIVELQAEKHTPYAREEVLIDFSVLERGRAGYSRVLLIIAHQDVIQRPVRLIEGAGLPLERVGCELEGLVNWFHLAKKGSAAGSGASLVVEVDHNTTIFLVMQRGLPQFHRNFSTGLEQLLAEPVPAAERLVSEFQQTIEAFDAEATGAKIQEVLLTGRIEQLEPFKAALEKGLSLPVNLVSPWAGREVSDPVRQTLERLPEVSFASLAGLAFGQSRIDLTPPAAKLRQAFEARARALVLLASQGVGALLLVCLLVIGRAQKEQRYYAILQEAQARVTQDATPVEEALVNLEFVKERLRHRGQLLESVETLATLTPQGLQWKSLAFTEGEGLILKGSSETLPKIYDFVATLDSEALFEHVEAKRVSKRKAGETDVTDFEITCPLSPTGTVR